MEHAETRQTLMSGGLCGIVGTCCYIAAITIPLPDVASYVLAMAWPVLSILFIFFLYRFLSVELSGFVHHLAFLFGVVGFTIVAMMISAQLAVRMGLADIAMELPGQEEALSLMRRSLRLVDMGLDVAWDLFIGVSLIFIGRAIGRHSKFGAWWGTPAILLGIALIVLNVITFPWPPDTQGLVDIGPFIGLFIILLGGRLLVLGFRTE